MTGKSPPSSSSTASGTNTFLGRFPGLDGGSGSSSGSRKQQECENPSTLKKSGSLEDIMKVSREFGDFQSLEDFGIKSEQEEQSHLAVSRSPRSPHLESPTCHPRFSRVKVIRPTISSAAATPSPFITHRRRIAPAKISHARAYRLSCPVAAADSCTRASLMMGADGLQCHEQELRQVVSLQDGIECPDDDFLILCLRVWQYSVKDAARVASNFARFRSKHGWGYRISAASVEKELKSGVSLTVPSPVAWAPQATASLFGGNYAVEIRIMPLKSLVVIMPLKSLLVTMPLKS